MCFSYLNENTAKNFQYSNRYQQPLDGKIMAQQIAIAI